MQRVTLERYLQKEPPYRVYLSDFDQANKVVRLIVEDGKDRIERSLRDMTGLVSKLQGVLSVRKCAEVDSSHFCTVAVDSGYNGPESLLGYIPLVFGVSATFQGAKKLHKPMLAATLLPRSDDPEEGRKMAGLVGFLLQFKLARKFLSSVDAVLIDGPLNMSSTHFSPNSRRYGELYLKTLSDAGRELVLLLDEAREQDIPVVGIVKRVRSSLISRASGMPDGRHVPDAALMSRVLSRGEYTSPVPADWMWDQLVLWCRESGINPSGLKIHSSFAKFGVRSPVRLDLPEYAIPRLDEVVSHLNNLSTPDVGIPLPVMAVDRLSKMKDEFVKMIYRKILSEVVREVGDPLLLNALGPQYGEDLICYREKWSAQ